MTDKMIPVPRELLEELRDCALDCNYEHRGEGYRQIVAQCDALLREAAQPEKQECCGNPAQCWEPCGQLGKSEAHTAVAHDEELRRDAERYRWIRYRTQSEEMPQLSGSALDRAIDAAIASEGDKP